MPKQSMQCKYILVGLTMKTYSELSKLKTFEERYEYLKESGAVGVETFGFDRYANQALYNSREWKRARDAVIIRDGGCDLGIEGRDIPQNVLVHHINPITMEQVINRDPLIFDPDNLITVSHRTHNAIHYGDKDQLLSGPVERSKGDTCPWKTI